jgi:hypothetical protein
LSGLFDESRIVRRRARDVRARHIDTHLACIETSDGINRNEEMTLTDSEKTARSNLDESNLSLAFIDKEAAYVPDLVSMPIDDLSTAEILTIVCEREARGRQSNESCAARRRPFRAEPRVVSNVFQNVS